MASLNGNALAWLDMEMTGLHPQKDRILEIAVLLTDSDLNVISEPFERVIFQSKTVLDGMDDWCQKTHGDSGLIQKVQASSYSESQVESELLNFLSQQLPEKTVPLCGNTIWQDRRFLFEHMPRLEQFFHYRCLDVSTLKELAKRWKPALFQNFEKQSTHTAMADVLESIEELKYYRSCGFVGG